MSRVLFNVPLVLTLFLAIGVFASPQSQAAPNASSPSVKATVAPLNLSRCAIMLTTEPIGRYESLGQSWTLAELIDPDPSVNLAAKNPTMLMNNDQMDVFVANKYPRQKKRDPAYRQASYWYYPLISAGVPEAGGHQVIGHYETMQRAMQYSLARAEGKRASKMLGFVGGAGTGKTVLGELLETAKANLAMTDPDYGQLTFEFTNLSVIPELRPLTYGMADGQSNPSLRDLSLNRSPLVLLTATPNLQRRVIELATPAFRKVTEAKGLKLDPIPFLKPSNKTQEVLDYIVAHYMREENKQTVTEQDYIRWISGHVKIKKRFFETTGPSAIIRYLGKHPDMGPLFFTENLTLSQFYGPKSALSYDYGLFLANDGKDIFVDEMFRQAQEVRDTLLDLGQNQVAQNGGAPAEKLNTTIYFATNDQSIEDAKIEGSASAHLNRTVRFPMRHPIEPWQAAKVAMYDIGFNKFTMRKIQAAPDVLSDEGRAKDPGVARPGEMVPFDKQVAIPDMDNGESVGTDGRYAIYYIPNRQAEPVMLAPRVLWMLGLVSSATRIVTDPKIFDRANKDNVEFDSYAKYRQYFTSPRERLNVLTGITRPPMAVAADLKKVRDLLKEGRDGIGARELENWFSEAVALAPSTGGAVTPVTLDHAFERMLNMEGITATEAERAKWIKLQKMVKANFILPALSADVLSILQGQGRAERLYDEIKREIITLSTDRDAEHVEHEGHNKIGINVKRLNEVYGLFREITNLDFEPGIIKDFHLSVSRESTTQRHPALLEAVRRWLAQTEIDKATITELVEYFDDKAVSENIRSMGSQAKAKLEAYGYDQASFVQALLFVRDQQFIIDRDSKKQEGAN